MLLVSLTGPSGAGKNEFAELLARRGIPHIDCDAISRELTVPGSDCLRELTAEFGGDILRPDGTLDRARLASLAFAAPERTAALSRITHRHILAEVDRRAAALAEAGCPAACVNGAALIESGYADRCDFRIALLADRDARRARVLARDGLTPEAADRRFSAQRDDGYYTAGADLVVRNDGDRGALAAAADRAAGMILRLPRR